MCGCQHSRSYWLLSTGTYSLHAFHFANDLEAGSNNLLVSRLVVSISSLPLKQTKQTSVSDALVCLMVTLLLFVMVAQIEIASPGTYPPLSSRTRHVTGPDVIQVRPILCSISQWKGC